MKISLLQPHIRRGEIAHNRAEIQTLIEQAQGELLVLPEYALTGSLTLETSPQPARLGRNLRQRKSLADHPAGQIPFAQFTGHVPRWVAQLL